MAERARRLPLAARAALPAVVVLVALLIGSGVLSSQPQSAAQRAASIESVVRCPSCIDVSVAQSEETTAVAVRHEIVRLVNQDRPTAQIEQTLVQQYGSTILLVPPGATGLALIWILPIALAVGALTVVGVFFWRRARQFAAQRAAPVEVS